MRRPSVRRLNDVAAQLLTDPARLGRTRLVLIDGPSGSGKTTLAARLTAAIEAARPGHRTTTTLIHLDDLYEGWSGLHADRGHGTVSRRLADLLEPLVAGRPGSWQRYDWAAGAFEEWHRVDPPDVLLLEGCGALDPAYDDRASLTIWVEVPRALRITRGIERDGEIMRAHWKAWQAAEDALYEQRRPRKRADLLVDGDPRVPHDQDREIVLLPRPQPHADAEPSGQP